MTPVTYFTHIYTKFAKERHILKKGTSLQLNKGTKCRFMHNYHITPLNVLKKSQLKTTLAILSFISVYVLISATALGLILLNMVLLFHLIWRVPNIFMVTLFTFLMVITIFLFILLIKFITKRHTEDKTHLSGITDHQQPELFSLIREVVNHTHTDFPHKVYFSPGVRISVFYSSTFWNLFFPAKRELIIGMGLLQATTISEFKALLAYELGHYSKKPLFFSNHIYDKNRIIFHLLYSKHSLDELADKWLHVKGTLKYITPLLFLPIKGLTWLLTQCYAGIYRYYQPLSKEMEFQADQLAAETAGVKPLAKALLRYEFARFTFNMILEYYYHRKHQHIQTRNLYPQYRLLMNFLARKNQLPFERHLPLVEMSQLSRYQMTKLVIQHQWAAHPTIHERVKRLEQLPLQAKEMNFAPAIHLLKDSLQVEEWLTKSHFVEQGCIDSPETPTFISQREFMEEYKQRYEAYAFHDMFSHYYDDKNPSRIDTAQAIETYASEEILLEELFNDQIVDWVYTLQSLENDLSTLTLISQHHFQISSFDYDGQKYHMKDVDQLIKWLKLEIDHFRHLLSENDAKIFVYFSQLASQQGKHQLFMASYLSLFQIGDTFTDQLNMYYQISDATAFFKNPLSGSTLGAHIKYLQNLAHEFKERIRYVLEADIYQPQLTQKIRTSFQQYLSQDDLYVKAGKYQYDVMDILLQAIRYFFYLIPIPFYQRKRALLEVKVDLVHSSSSHES